MGTLDWIVLGIFCLGLVGIIIWVVRQKDETSTDYFLAGRDATWLAIGSSIFASNIGSEHLVGLAGAGASSGMAMAHWEMHGWLILILGWFFVPFYERSGVFTMPEFLEKRYNKGSRSVSVNNFTCKLCVYKSGSYSICRWYCFQAGFWY